MKRIKLLQPRVGEGIVQKPGDELVVGDDVTESEAEAMVFDGIALDISPPVKRKAIAPKKKSARKAVKP